MVRSSFLSWTSRLRAPLTAVLWVLAFAATPAAAQDDDEPPAAADQPADPPAPAAGDADGDGTPDDKEPPAPAAGDADGDGTPDDKEPPAPAAGDADGDGTPDAVDTDDDNDGVPDAQEPPAAGDADGDGTPDAVDTDDDNDGVPDDQEVAAGGAEVDEDGQVYLDDDADGDGVVEADEAADAKEFDAAFDDIPDVINDDALDARAEESELVPSLDIETFRTLVRLAKKKVLTRMEAKIKLKAEQKMATVSWGIFFLSLLGFLLLAMPFALNKKHPGQMGNLVKYSALAAVTFFVTVNLFGAILIGLRTTQSALASQTNPQLKIAAGFFDALDHNAEDYAIMGKELFGPTLEQLSGKSDEQPAVLLIENGQKIVEQASVFKTVAGMFKRVNFIFGILPIVLLGVTLLLFMLAIKPTLIEIIKLPATAASGQGSTGVVQRAMRRVGGEMVATVCTLGVLVLLTLLSGFILGQVVEPALDSIISYFSLAVIYLQWVEGASTAQVMLMLFSVILFLVFNLAVVILSMSFFLGKSQKIFQQRFNDGVPLSAHRRWWIWGPAAVLLAQLLPWLYVQVAAIGVEKIENRVTAGVTDADKLSWTMLMLPGPLFLIVGFLIFYWAARGLKSIGFLATYQVKLPASLPVPAAPSP